MFRVFFFSDVKQFSMSPYYNNWLFNVFPTCNLLPLFSASDDQKRCLFIMLSCFTWFTPNLICVFVLVKNNCVKNIHQHSVGSMSTVASIDVHMQSSNLIEKSWKKQLGKVGVNCCHDFCSWQLLDTFPACK